MTSFNAEGRGSSVFQILIMGCSGQVAGLQGCANTLEQKSVGTVVTFVCLYMQAQLYWNQSPDGS